MKRRILDLERKIKKRQARIGIIGLGYVGLPLIIRFGDENFKVIGFDIDEEKIKKLNKGESYIKHIQSEKIRRSLRIQVIQAKSSSCL